MANNALGLPALISPYPGGKSGGRYFRKFGGHVQSLICDRLNYYDVIVEPFAGSGATVWQHPHGATSAIAADIDPGVQAVWECWQDRDGDRATVLKLLDWNRKQVQKDPLAHFEFLKDAWNRRYFCMSMAAAAASYLTLKRLVFGGTVRSNRKGKLNVALSKNENAKTESKLTRYLKGNPGKKRCQETKALFNGLDQSDYWGWRYQWPDNGIKSVTLQPSWEHAVEALAASDHERALVVIDPPYYSDQVWIEERHDGRLVQSKMTAAYAEHNPQSQAELQMCVDCLDAVLATGKAARIVVFNYYTEALGNAIKEMISMSTYDCHASNLGPLGNMNNAQKFHGRDSEWVWEIGGRRMFRAHNALQQLSLV